MTNQNDVAVALIHGGTALLCVVVLCVFLCVLNWIYYRG